MNYIDENWFQGRRVGHNTLETFMKKLCEEANLNSKIYTNDSIRSTCISNLDENGFEARHITALTSHKSEATIREYSVKCPDSKKREMFNALAKPIQTKKFKTEHTVTSETAIALKDTSNQMTPNFSLDLQLESPQLPELQNCDLLEMDPIEDNLLVEILTQTEKALQHDKTVTNDQTTAPVSHAVTNVQQNTFNPTMPIVPRMYFPHSNVTINYNFTK